MRSDDSGYTTSRMTKQMEAWLFEPGRVHVQDTKVARFQISDLAGNEQHGCKHLLVHPPAQYRYSDHSGRYQTATLMLKNLLNKSQTS